MMTSLYSSVDAIEWACVLCDCHILNDSVEQRICITFCIQLEHSSVEIIQMIQKATAMVDWWLAASSQQCTHSWITSSAEIFGKTSNHPGDSAPYSPDLMSWDFWLFLKQKPPFKGKGFQTVDEIQENTTGQLMAIGRTVWSSKEPFLKGTEALLSDVQFSLYLLK